VVTGAIWTEGTLRSPRRVFDDCRRNEINFIERLVLGTQMQVKKTAWWIAQAMACIAVSGCGGANDACDAIDEHHHGQRQLPGAPCNTDELSVVCLREPHASDRDDHAAGKLG